MKKRSLKFNLITGGVLAAVVPLAVVGLIALIIFSKQMMQTAEGQASLLAQSLASMTEIAMEDELTLTQEMAHNDLLVSGLVAVQQNGLDGAGDILRQLDTLISKYIKTGGSRYESIFLADSTGKIIADSQGGQFREKGIKVSDRDYFQTAKNGTPNLGDALQSKVSGQPIVCTAVPIKDSSQKIIGVFCTVIRLDTLSKKIARFRIGETGYPFLVDKNGIALAHPDPKRIFTLNIKKTPGMEEIAKEMLSQKTDVKEYVLEGTPKIAGYAPVPLTKWSIAVTQNEAEFLAGVAKVRNIILIAIVIFLAITVAAVLGFVKSIMKLLGKDPSEIAQIADSIAHGDLTVSFDAKDAEITGVFSSMKTMTENLTSMFTDIKTGIHTLTSSSTELSAISDQMAGNSSQTSDRANNVAAAAEEMTSNMNSVAAATEQTSANIQMIAAATEEMTTTINEIAQNTNKGSQTTSGAVKQAEEISIKVEELGRAASEISKVTETIADISEQTNLLALNATIEAARAGEAGKGFAVVAAEIKALANQTADATGEISSRIGGIQTSTQESIFAIKEIVTVIDNINSIVTGIAAAIEEQSSSTQEISNNVNQAASGVQEVNENVNQMSVVAGDVSKDVHGISDATHEMNIGSNQVNESATELSSLAESLNVMVKQFKTKK